MGLIIEKVENAVNKLGKLKPRIYLVIIVIILISLTSCTPATGTPTVSIPAEISLPEKVRVKGAAWVADDILAYYAEDGVHIWNAESGEGPVLNVSNTFNTDNSALFALTPDHSKICVSVMNNRGERSYSVFAVKSGKLLKHIELIDDLGKRFGIYGYRYEIGFFDEKILYAYNQFGIWFVNINTGEQRRITADAADFYESCNKDGRDYFEWVYSPVMVNGKLYYSGIRDEKWQPRIYCADLSGETMLNIPSDATMLASVPGNGFIYFTKRQSDDQQVWYYDIKNASSDLVSDQSIYYIFVRGSKIVYDANQNEKIEIDVNLYDIDTKKTQAIKIYNAERDFPEEDYFQLNRISGFVPDGDGYAFLFTVGHQNKTVSMIVGTYLAYSTETDKAIAVADYNDYWVTETDICPSGDFTLITNHNLSENGYPLEVVKTSEYIHPDVAIKT